MACAEGTNDSEREKRSSLQEWIVIAEQALRNEGSNQNLWARRAGEKFLAFFVIFKNTDKHAQFACGSKKGLRLEYRQPLLLNS